MISGLWGRKIGMTQLFSQDQKVVPVTAITLGNWYITQVKNAERDGYNAVQLGCVKKRYENETFSAEWLHKPKKYFDIFREVALRNTEEMPVVGQQPSLEQILDQGNLVDVFGKTIGKGFQGVVKRHNFAGGRQSHGDKMGRTPGALSGMTSCGKVLKGKAMPGHMGTRQRVMKNLEIVRMEPSSKLIFVKGSIPGKTGSLVFVRRCS